MELFKGRYQHIKYWKDHHAPNLKKLLDLCQNMYWLQQKDPDLALVIHCDGGKGRTGVLTCCYLMYLKFADTAKNALIYFGNKRMSHGLAVTQPSQIMYVFYFEKLLQGIVSIPKLVCLKGVYVNDLPKIKNNFRI